MNYANWIQEEKLKKTFIIATLCSTLVSTFTSSMGLWERVQNTRKQSKRDKQQDSEIKQLRETIEKAEKRGRERDEERERIERRLLERGDRDEIGDNFRQSGALIQRQFDEGYGRLGRRFAEGDTITENLLQKQIITLQQTVINVLQDALYNKRELTRADMAKLVAASDAAREGSLSALRSQQQRLALEEAAPPLQASPQRALTAPKRASSVAETDPLFCRYSLNLQYIPKKTPRSVLRARRRMQMSRLRSPSRRYSRRLLADREAHADNRKGGRV